MADTPSANDTGAGRVRVAMTPTVTGMTSGEVAALVVDAYRLGAQAQRDADALRLDQAMLTAAATTIRNASLISEACVLAPLTEENRHG